MSHSFRILTTISLMGYFCLMGLFSCQNEDENKHAEIVNRDSMPTLSSYGVSTLISDSGVIRYKIISEEWLVFDKTERQHWSFEKGLFIEKFGNDYHVEAFVNCDTAYYYSEEQLWELRGRVCVKNLKGETFKTSLLYWNTNQHEIYSPAYMVIDGIEQDLDGYNFRSNETMTDYIIHSSSGAFPMGKDREIPSRGDEDALKFQSDTTAVSKQ